MMRLLAKVDGDGDFDTYWGPAIWAFADGVIQRLYERGELNPENHDVAEMINLFIDRGNEYGIMKDILELCRKLLRR